MIRLLFPLVFIVLIVVWVRTILDIIRTQDYQYRAGNQIVWLLVVILLPLIGVPLYWVFGAPQR
jgi:phospholipase D-like protein